MADRFAVDIDALETFAGQLDTTRLEFDSTTNDVSSAAASLADPRLTAALEDFDRRWSAGREVLDSYFTALSRMARDSAQALRDQDKALADQLK